VLRILLPSVLVVLLAGCSSTPEELPFRDDPIEVPADDMVIDDAIDTPDDRGEEPSGSPEPVAVDEVFDTIGVDPVLGACYAEVFGDAGVTEIVDLQDFADRSASLSAEDQERLADCLNP